MKWVGLKIACTIDFNDLRTPFLNLEHFVRMDCRQCCYIYIYIYIYTHTKLWPYTVDDELLIFVIVYSVRPKLWRYIVDDELLIFVIVYSVRPKLWRYTVDDELLIFF